MQEAACTECVGSGSCTSHHTTRPRVRGGVATMILLGDRMVEYWGYRGNMMEGFLAYPGYMDAMVEWGPWRLTAQSWGHRG